VLEHPAHCPHVIVMVAIKSTDGTVEPTHGTLPQRLGSITTRTLRPSLEPDKSFSSPRGF
jgi:hypothetical protein